MSKQYSIQDEVKAKIGFIREIIQRKNLAAVLLSQKYNILWLTAGRGNQVLYDMQNSLIGILITPEKTLVIAENGDLDRVREEEFSHCPFEYTRIFWNSGGIGAEAARHAAGLVGVDSPSGMDDEINVDGDIQEYRMILLEGEADRCRQYGKEASRILTNVARETRPGVKESEIAALLSKGFVENGFTIAVILIGGDERSLRYRHQVVTDNVVQHHYSLCGVGKKGGLTFPINRIVSFGDPPALVSENHVKIEKVFVHLNSLCTIGTRLKDIYASLPEIFGAAGLDKNEWVDHSIGGTMGYHPREICIAPEANYAIQENNVIGWNPSLPGVMSEDVYLVTKQGLEFATFDESWPFKEVESNGLAQDRPSILCM